ncbi:MAG: DUF481 domain-containing protein [Bacteroidetes bacterium]|nr:DUF481 domain-containing protein [Bacteroidota bacterium]
MKQFPLLLLACLFSLLSAGQIINIDKTDTSAYARKNILSGNVSLGMEVDKQKTTLFDASNYVDLAMQQYRELFVLSASNRFTYNGPQDFLNTGYVHLRWRHRYKDTWHPETFVQYQWDDERGMLHRFVGGENIRYNIDRGSHWDLSVATGVFYEEEVWNYTAVDSSKIPANPFNVTSRELKSNNYIKWEGKLSDAASLSAILFYQASFKDFFKPRVSAAISFDINVSRHFAWGVRYTGLYDVEPVVPIFKFYYSFSNSLVYKF